MKEHPQDGTRFQSKFLATAEPWADCISLRYGFHTADGSRVVGVPMTFAKQERNMPVAPFLEISGHDAQQLMDSLWDCGIRPSEGSGSAGALAATQRHLEDMRTLVFKPGELGVPK